MEWTNLHSQLAKWDKHVLPPTENGFCFINAIEFVVVHDHSMYVPVETISQSIYSHIQENSYYCNDFHSGDENKVLSDIEEFYSTGICDHDIVDVIMNAAAQALILNIYTYQECEEHTKILKQLCGITEAKCVCHKYSSDHCDAIVNASKEGW